MEKSALASARVKTSRDGDGEVTDDTTTEETPRRVDPDAATPRIDRTVWTRTHNRITLDLVPPNDDAVADPPLRGWRSPHGEPYRPLGNPNLGLKYTPRLHLQPSKDDRGRRAPSPPPPSSSTVSVTSPAAKPTPPPPHVLDMFPRNLRKRPPDDRQVKLAARFQESISQYSPEKTRSLRCANPVTITRIDDATADDNHGDDDDLHEALLRLQAQHASPPSSPVASPRYHVQHGDASFLLLRDAVHQGAARLQLVRNGQNFLGAVPTPESPMDLAALKRQYDHARVRYLVDLETRKKRGGNHSLHRKPDDDSDDDGDAVDSHVPHPNAPDDAQRLYLPYTTRAPQSSPHKPLPTLAEFKAKAREERLPVRTLVSSRASMMNDGGSPRKPSSSSPRALSVARRTVPFVDAPSSPPAKPTRAESRRGSVVLTPQQNAETLDPESDALARAVATMANAASSSPRVHSVVRLQTAVDAVEAVKDVQTQALSKTLAALEQDRRMCLETKYRNLNIDSQLDVDMDRMRLAAELERVDTAVHNVASYRWYADLLRHLLACRESGHPLHPAELFCLDVIRCVAIEGNAFRREQLFRLILLLHPDDVAVGDVQQLLTFLRRVLVISSLEWTSFFQAHNLPEPVEIFKPSEESKLKEKKKQLRLAKIRSVVRINQVLRRLTTPHAGIHTPQ